MSYTTGVPPVVGAMMMFKGAWKGEGVFNVEQLPPEPFLEELGPAGPAVARARAENVRAGRPVRGEDLVVMPGLACAGEGGPGTPSTSAGAGGALDPGDKRRDDIP